MALWLIEFRLLLLGWPFFFPFCLLCIQPDPFRLIIQQLLPPAGRLACPGHFRAPIYLTPRLYKDEAGTPLQVGSALLFISQSEPGGPINVTVKYKLTTILAGTPLHINI